MNQSGLRNYPVSVEKDGSGRFRATLIDLPGPAGTGATEREALRDLTDRAVPLLNDLAARGQPVAPSEVADCPFIGVSPLIPIQRPPPPQPVQPKAPLLSYGWTETKPRGGA